jgi:hypothetical protein
LAFPVMWTSQRVRYVVGAVRLPCRGAGRLAGARVAAQPGERMQGLVVLAGLAAILYGVRLGGVAGGLTALVAAVGTGSGLAMASAEAGNEVAGGAGRRTVRLGGVIAACGCLVGAYRGGWTAGWAWGVAGYVTGPLASFIWRTLPQRIAGEDRDQDATEGCRGGVLKARKSIGPRGAYHPDIATIDINDEWADQPDAWVEKYFRAGVARLTPKERLDAGIETPAKAEAAYRAGFRVPMYVYSRQPPRG